MENDKQGQENDKLSYEILNKRLEEQNKLIAEHQAQIEDLKEVIRLNFSVKKGDNDKEEPNTIDKKEFERRLKEDLKIC